MVTQAVQSSANLSPKQFRRVKNRHRGKMTAAEMLWLLKLNHHTNITLLHSTLNCVQMVCVMTCSAERGIHQETIELVQKNPQLQETSLVSQACLRKWHDHILYNSKVTPSRERKAAQYSRTMLFKTEKYPLLWTHNSTKESKKCQQQQSFPVNHRFWQLVSISMVFYR